MKLKHSVSLTGIRPEIIIAIMAAMTVFNALKEELILTSIRDGKHSQGSRHYIGLAIDIRIRHLSDEIAKLARDNIKKALTNDFDIILESDHIHIEYDPRYKEYED